LTVADRNRAGFIEIRKDDRPHWPLSYSMLYALFRIRIGLNRDPDPDLAFEFNMDPNPAFEVNTDSDPAFEVNTDPGFLMT